MGIVYNGILKKEPAIYCSTMYYVHDDRPAFRNGTKPVSLSSPFAARKIIYIYICSWRPVKCTKSNTTESIIIYHDDMAMAGRHNKKKIVGA